MRLRILCGAMVIAWAACVGVTPAVAQSAEDAFKARKAAMGTMGRSFGQIARFLRGEGTMADAAAAAAAINENAQKIVALFPPGSGRDAIADSRATPEVWNSRAEFEALAAKLVESSANLAEAAKSGDRAKFEAEFGSTRAACTNACHGGPSNAGGKFRFEQAS